MHFIEEAAYDTEVTRGTAGAVYHYLRDMVSAFMTKIYPAGKIGGPDKVVCIDETYITKKKKNRGGFRGRQSLGYKTCIMAGVELSSADPGRHETG